MISKATRTDVWHPMSAFCAKTHRQCIPQLCCLKISCGWAVNVCRAAVAKGRCKRAGPSRSENLLLGRPAMKTEAILKQILVCFVKQLTNLNSKSSPLCIDGMLFLATQYSVYSPYTLHYLSASGALLLLLLCPFPSYRFLIYIFSHIFLCWYMFLDIFLHIFKHVFLLMHFLHVHLRFLYSYSSLFTSSMLLMYILILLYSFLFFLFFFFVYLFFYIFFDILLILSLCSPWFALAFIHSRPPPSCRMARPMVQRHRIIVRSPVGSGSVYSSVEAVEVAYISRFYIRHSLYII